ncbi:PREDICTED: trichohyalin-like [Papilio xuthus]|uniref:Trichohyalin-like n=1 Tax=Papilio xuthus TaxID=66420 RepID=A0AAJ6Z2H1_PAPXU|nr:PREDICTED: trichohyalin-like [Papilio xuthus]
MRNLLQKKHPKLKVVLVIFYRKIRISIVHFSIAAIKQKREQQMTNRLNFIEGHELKILRLKNEKNREREIDLNHIRIAEEELRKEKEDKMRKMRNLQKQSTIFVDYHYQERNMAAELEQQSEKILHEIKTNEDKRNEEHKKQKDEARKHKKEIALQEYRQHLENVNKQNIEAKLERKEQMKNVKKTAYCELQKKLNSANEELQKQLDYRHDLTEQIKNNHLVLETELKDIEQKQNPFTKKAITFKDAMRNRVNISKEESTTNPVHPFRKVIQKHQKYSQPLPQIIN